MLGLDADGRAQMTAVTAANAIFGGIFKAAEGKGADASPSAMTAEVPGLGDRAVRVPNGPQCPEGRDADPNHSWTDS